MVIATQNPIEMEGTYALPEAQRDRFTARVSIGYPDPAAELAMVDEHAGAQPARRPAARCRTPTRCSTLIETVRAVKLSPEIRRYAVELVSTTRRLPEIRHRRVAAVHAAPGPRGPRAGRAVRAATSWSPTTCTRWPCRCSRTGSC